MSNVLTCSAVLHTIRVLAHNGPVRIDLARWQGRLVVTKRVLGIAPNVPSRQGRPAAVSGRLSHDNIAPLWAVKGDVLVYAYCPGVNLAELIDAGHLGAGRMEQIMTGVLAALEFAHARGVIHLDVKPSNILVRGSQALLTDFGFAKDLALANITSEHALLGTPGYMAPEQFRGIRDDPRSDIFAAAAVLYHMLAGEPPFGRDALRFLTGDDSVRLTPLSGRAAAFNEPVSQALSRDAEDMFASVRAFRAALQPVFPAASMSA